MEGNFLTSGDLAMYENAKDGHNCGCGCGNYGYRHGHGGVSTGIALGASGLAVAIIGALAVGWGVNQASKARARGAENLSNANAKTLELLAGVVAQEKTRTNGVEIDVQQTLRSLTGATAQGGSANANALATAEALALLQNNNSGLNSAVGGCNFLRVARYSAPQPCGCDTCND